MENRHANAQKMMAAYNAKHPAPAPELRGGAAYESTAKTVTVAGRVFAAGRWMWATATGATEMV